MRNRNSQPQGSAPTLTLYNPVNTIPPNGWNSAKQGLQNAQDRANHAVQKLASGNPGASLEPMVELARAKVQHRANTKMLNTLDRTKGTLLDLAT